MATFETGKLLWIDSSGLLLLRTDQRGIGLDRPLAAKLASLLSFYAAHGDFRGFLDGATVEPGAKPACEPLPDGWAWHGMMAVGPRGQTIWKSSEHPGQFFAGQSTGAIAYHPTAKAAIEHQMQMDDDDDVEPNLEGRVEALDDHYDRLQADFAQMKSEQAVTNDNIASALEATAVVLKRIDERLQSLERRGWNARSTPRPTPDISKLLVDAIMDTEDKLTGRRDVY